MDRFSVSGNIVDVINERIFPGTLEISGGRILAVMPDNAIKSENYIMPGLIDAHIHIESSMLTPSEFARLAVRHGTVATVSDPHEIANVLGIDGINYMIADGERVPMKFYFGASSCVPATPFETSGAKISLHEIESLLANPKIKYMSEMMNFPGVLYDVPEVMEKIRAAQKAGKPIDGHAPGLSGENAKKYIEAGISTDHECYTIEEAREKIDYGMKILIRNGSAAKNFETLAPLLIERPDMCMLCSDDRHPDDLVAGHINKIIAQGVKMGIPLMKLLRAATINPSLHYKLHTGMLWNGDSADFIIVDNLEEFNVSSTYIGGNLVAQSGKALFETLRSDEPNKFLAHRKNSEDFRIEAKGGNIKVIEAIDGEIVTGALTMPEKSEDGYCVSDVDNDILKIAVINRYEDSKPAVAFIKNFGLKRGAIASSVGHDSHNIIAVGVTDEEICRAVNGIIEKKGGMAAATSKEIVIQQLPVAGIMSADEGFDVASKYSKLNTFAHLLGTKLSAPFMTLSFMALLVIPKLKLSDKGLFDGESFSFTDLHV